MKINPYGRSYQSNIFDNLPIRGNEKILDLGCKDGFLTAFMGVNFPKTKIIGIDPSEDHIKTAKRTYRDVVMVPNIKFRQGEIKNIDYRNMDMILSFDFHDIKDKEACIDRIHRCLKPSGIFGLCAAQGLSIALVRAIYQPKWIAFTLDGEVNDTFMPKSYYEKILTKNFEVEDIRTYWIEKIYRNVDELFYSMFYYNSIPHIKDVPERFKEEFVSDLKKEYCNSLPPDEKGRVKYRYHALEIIAKKD